MCITGEAGLIPRFLITPACRWCVARARSYLRLPIRQVHGYAAERVI